MFLNRRSTTSTKLNLTRVADISDVNEKIGEDGVFEGGVERRNQFGGNVWDKPDLKHESNADPSKFYETLYY